MEELLHLHVMNFSPFQREILDVSHNVNGPAGMSQISSPDTTNAPLLPEIPSTNPPSG